ncbi:PREDICTED: uncharacterized protein At2g40430 isoform X2 [Tarenaya hassleriana]|uniref:uncharacterized protein At2g40430 isoform X2 n=1 Tax=Tarenaya hassleriana TaxID=28532 RepID=UPI00053C26CF|nr:PREDICTED: uncharacterized protein At2g40430 isoform X2 [Tarenaya hassleriana]
MGKRAKSSRKGKKAWRANISTEDIEDFYEKTTKDALSGGNLSAAPTEELFHVDKSRDLSVKRKIEKHRVKVLRCDSILQKNPFVQAVPSSKPKAKKNEKTSVKATEPPKEVEKVNGDDSGMADLWGDGQGEQKNYSRKASKPSIIPPAVEVEPAGCSYNPSFDSHQDVLAEAVAQEMQKVYKVELGPEPVPLTIEGEKITEEDRYFLEVDNGSDGEDDADDENKGTESEKRLLKTKRVTRVELNKRSRQKEQQKKESEEKKKTEISKEIDSLPSILQEIANEDEEKQKRHLRRVIAKQEILKTRPPRLGKHKFEPAPVQVLLSEEVTGSLRKLKACCTLARDRFKSLEKRGLIVPTKNTRKN